MSFYGVLAVIAVVLSAARLAIAWIEYREHRRPRGGERGGGTK